MSNGIVWVTPMIEVSPTSYGSYQNVDVDSYVGGLGDDVTGVILRIVNTNGTSNYSWSVRKDGSTDDIYGDMQWGATCTAAVGVSSDHIFEVKIENANIDVYLAAVCKGGFNFLTNVINKTPGTTGSWQDVDCHTECPNATGLIFKNTNSSTLYAFGWRKNGSTDNRIAETYVYSCGYFTVGCDAGQICEIYCGNANPKAYLAGYITSDSAVVMNTNAPSYDIASQGVWQDFSALPEGAIGGLFECYSTGAYAYGLRKNGNSQAIIYRAKEHCDCWVECDANRIVEAYCSHTSVIWYLMGYITRPTETRAQTYDFDALVKVLDRTSSHDIDFLALKAQEAAFTDDALLRGSFDLPWTVSAKFVPGHRELEYPFDAVLALVREGVITPDILIQKRNTPVTFDFDLLLKKLAITESLDIDMMMQAKDKSASSSMDLLAQIRNLSEAFEMDLLAQVRDKSVSSALDLLLQIRNRSVEAQLDMMLQAKSIPETYELDVGTKRIGANSADFDTLVKMLGLEDSTTHDLIMKKAWLASIDSDLLLKKLGIDTSASADILLKKLGFTVSSDADLLLKKLGFTASEAIDLLLKRYGVDKSIDSDILLKKLGFAQSANLDLLIKKGLIAPETVDLLLKRFNLSTGLDADFILKLEGVDIYDIDLLLKKLDLSASMAADFLIGKIWLAIVNSDLLLKRFNIESSIDADVLLKRLGITTSAEFDVILKLSGLTASEAMDLLLRRYDIPASANVDTILKRIVNAPIDVDLLLNKLDLIAPLTIDVCMKSLNVANLNTDLLLKKFSISTSSTADVLLKRIGLAAADSDMVLALIDLPTSATVDMLLKRLGLNVSVPLDILLKKRDITVSANADSIIKVILSKAFDADLFLKRLGIPVSASADILLQTLGIPVTAEVDAILKRQGVTASEAMDLLLSKWGVLKLLDVNMFLEKQDLDVSMASDLLTKVRNLATIAAVDLLLKAQRSKSATADILLENEFSRTYRLGLRQKKASPLDQSMDLILKRIFGSEWGLALYMKRYDIVLSYLAHLATLKAMDVFYALNVRLIPQMWVVLVAGTFVMRTTKLSYLAEGLLFGNGDECYSADIILSDRPTKYRQPRYYPSSPDAPVGVVEFHGVSFEHTPIERRPRTYPKTKPEHTEPEVHPDSFDYESSKHKNRQVKITYR